MVQNVLLIWLDSNIDDGDPGYRNMLTQLRRVVNTINTYTDGEQCVEFLRTMDNDKACMIISSSLGPHIVPRVHDMTQVETIFIFCGSKQGHEEWTKEWPKIKGIFTEITSICEALKKAAHKCEQDAIPISFLATSDDISQKKLDQLEPVFMYTQIVKEILLDITFEPQHFQGFIQYWREAVLDNDKELDIVKRFEQHYCDETPIWWYTCTCFLYTMLNRALRLMDTDMIIRMGFFVSDLHRHIEKLHEQQFAGHRSREVFTVYRGQGLSAAHFEQLSKTKGGLMSFNSFLSTSKNPDVSLMFAENAMVEREMVDILFVMAIDPAKSTTPFASITGVSYYEHGEDEVLFSMHTVFRIEDITPRDGNPRLFQVTLTLTSEDDKNLRQLTDLIRQETNPTDQGWFRLGFLLLKMGQAAKAQETYQILLEHTTVEGEKGRIYQGLGSAHSRQGYHQEAITFYEKSLAIQQQSLLPNHPHLATSYNNIGSVYFNMGDYAKALSYYEKDLEISKQSLSPNHPHLATSYNNIGLVYDNMGEYPKAISSYEKSLAIQQQSLPPNHPALANSYNNIGLVYDNMGDYTKALSSYEKALPIQQKSLPPNHPSFATSYNNIGMVYFKMGDYRKALSFYEKALTIQQQSLPPNHPSLATSYNNIGRVYENMGDYAKALSHYELAVNILQRTLAPDHPSLQTCRKNLESVKETL